MIKMIFSYFTLKYKELYTLIVFIPVNNNPQNLPTIYAFLS